MEKKLLNYFTKFEFTDLVGFATLMKVPSELIKKSITDFSQVEELIITSVENFSKLSRKERRQNLRLAKEIAAENSKNNVKTLGNRDDA